MKALTNQFDFWKHSQKITDRHKMNAQVFIYRDGIKLNSAHLIWRIKELLYRLVCGEDSKNNFVQYRKIEIPSIYSAAQFEFYSTI